MPVFGYFGFFDDTILFELVICVLEGADRLLWLVSAFIFLVFLGFAIGVMRPAFIGHVLQIGLVGLWRRRRSGNDAGSARRTWPSLTVLVFKELLMISDIGQNRAKTLQQCSRLLDLFFVIVELLRGARTSRK